MKRTKRKYLPMLKRTKIPVFKKTPSLPSQPYKEQELHDTVIYTKEQLEEKLNENIKMFCKLYLEEYNATMSYMRAYKKPHSTYNSCAASSSFLLRLPKIKQYLEFLKSDIEKTVGFSKIQMLKELKAVATANLPEMYDNWIRQKDLERLKSEEPELCKAIKEISTKVEMKLNALKEPVEVVYVKISLHDKLGAIEKIFRAMGWNEPDTLNVNIQPLFPDVSY